jgi:hypothetical protein
MTISRHFSKRFIFRLPGFYGGATGILFLLLLGIGSAVAQDSLKQQTIDIFSSYQPKLKEAVKLNLTTNPPELDSSRPRMTYEIPALNLYFEYQPVPLRPLAMGSDTLPGLLNNFIKGGIGNYSTPLLQLGLGSDRNSDYSYGVYFSHLSSKGQIQNQAFSNDELTLHGKYFHNGIQFDGGLEYVRQGINYYGYNHDSLKYSASDVGQVYNNFSVNVGLRNDTVNTLGINYAPALTLTRFFDSHEHSESTFYLNAPIEKTIADGISISASLIGDYSNYSDPTQSIANNVSAIHPALNIVKTGFTLHAGLNPTWSINKFYLLPDIVNETNLIKDEVILSSGWISYIVKNSFQHMAEENPFINGYSTPQNTRVEEKYTGIKGTINNHFNYNTKFSLVTYSNLPLFVNDSQDGKTFYPRYESQLTAYQLHGEVGYVSEEGFQAKFSLDWFDYLKQQTEKQPWGLVPFRAEFSVQYELFKNFRLTSDAFIMSGSYYLQKSKSGKTPGAVDMNAGVSYQISKNFGLWFNANNIFSSNYQRWHNYPALGSNLIGGILIKF